MEPIHAKRIQIGKPVMKPLAAMVRLDGALEIEPRLRNLINLRASQINGCAFCLGMHWQ
jgi:alkylhydroperoxidase family enzyme